MLPNHEGSHFAIQTAIFESIVSFFYSNPKSLCNRFPYTIALLQKRFRFENTKFRDQMWNFFIYDAALGPGIKT